MCLLELPPVMILDVLRNPRATLELATRERQVWAAATVVAVWALLNLLLTGAFLLGEGWRTEIPGFSTTGAGPGVLAAFAAFVLPFVWWIGLSALLLLTIRLFGSRSPLSSVLVVVGIACVPWVAGYVVQLPLGVLQLVSGDQSALFPVLGWLTLVVSLGVFVWHVFLVVLGTSAAAGTGYRSAGASCALAGLGCATAAFILGVSVVTLVFILSGAI